MLLKKKKDKKNLNINVLFKFHIPKKMNTLFGVWK